MSLIIAHTSPLAERQEGERSAVIVLTRGKFGFRLRARCHESNRVIGGWVGDDPRAVVEIAMGWLGSYSWDIRQGETPEGVDQLDVNQALAVPTLQGDAGHVQDLIEALRQNLPPKHPTIPETGARVLLDRAHNVRVPGPAPAPSQAPAVEAGSPDEVEDLIARGRRSIARGNDPQRVAHAVAERLGVSAADAWFMLNPPGGGAEAPEEEEIEAPPVPRRGRTPRHEPQVAPPNRGRSPSRDQVQRVQRQAVPTRAPAPTTRQPNGRLRPLGRDEVPAVMTEDEARFLQSASAGGRDYEKLQRTHERAARVHRVANETAARNEAIRAAVARGEAARRNEPQRARRAREEEEFEAEEEELDEFENESEEEFEEEFEEGDDDGDFEEGDDDGEEGDFDDGEEGDFDDDEEGDFDDDGEGDFDDDGEGDDEGDGEEGDDEGDFDDEDGLDEENDGEGDETDDEAGDNADEGDTSESDEDTSESNEAEDAERNTPDDVDVIRSDAPPKQPRIERFVAAEETPPTRTRTRREPKPRAPRGRKAGSKVEQAQSEA